ncbi:MAG TPA: hypothetical protein VFE51_23360 [Verrucomicrobiae bacterium]|nr:hypothetical protein [Verrucomicrobiae bacterium]
MNKSETILTQTVEQLERMSEALATLRKELLPGQPKKFAILAESPLEEMRRLQGEIEQLTAEITAKSPAAA